MAAELFSQPSVTLVIGVAVAAALIGVFWHRRRSAAASALAPTSPTPTPQAPAPIPDSDVSFVRLSATRVLAGDRITGTVEVALASGLHLPAQRTELALTSSTCTVLGPLVANAAELMKLPGASNSYVLKFSPEARRKLKDGTLRLVPARDGGLRPFLAGADGKIEAMATLQKAWKVPLGAAAVWQALAVVTAQKFLADIDAGLTRIEASLKDLRDEFYATQLGELQGDLVYLIGLRRMIADGEQNLEAVQLAQLESLIMKGYGSLATIRLRLAQLANKARELVKEGKSGAATAQSVIAELKRLDQLFNLVAAGQMLAIQFQAAADSSAPLSKSRLADIEREALAHRRRCGRLLGQARRLGRGWRFALRYPFHRLRVLDESVRLASQGAAQKSKAASANLDEAIRCAAENVASLLDDAPLTLLVEAGRDGELTQVALLPAGSEQSR